MADMMQFDLVSPERSLASHPASAVQIPAAEGDLTAMPGHAPLIATLRPGLLTVTGPEGDSSFAVTGGFVEINLQGTTVLAEQAYPRDVENRPRLEALLEEARASAAEASGDSKDVAEKFVADLVHLLERME